MSKQKNIIVDFFGDILSLPFLILVGPVAGSPTGTLALALKLSKIVTFIIILIICLIVLFVGLSQYNSKANNNLLSGESVSYLDDYKNGKNKTYFSSQLVEFIKKNDGVRTPAGSNPPVLEGECVSLVKYWQHAIGGGHSYWVGNYPNPAFEAYLSGANSIAYANIKYSLTTLKKEQVVMLNAGDLVILTGFPSHTAIATGRHSAEGYEVFEQNAPKLGSPPNLSFYNNSTFIGAIRYNPK
jgi:hypothetical protein